jgi:nitrate/nitrite transport system substrate-binding protein
MSEFFDPYNADRPLMMKCSCGRDHTLADHHAEANADAAAATLRARSETSEFEAYSNEFIEATLVKALFPQDAVRRRFLRAVGKGTAMAAISSVLPMASLQAMAQDKNALEKTNLKIGFIPITCATPLIMAHPLGFYSKQGLNVEVTKTAGWALIRDKMINKEYDAVALPVAHAAGHQPGAGQQRHAHERGHHPEHQRPGHHPEPQAQRQPRPQELEGLQVRHPVRVLDAQLPVALLPGRKRAEPRHRRAAARVPPAEMVANLRAGNIDGFLGPDPFNQRAVFDEVGFIHVLTKDLWNGHPCCAFGTSTEFIQKNPNTFAALYRAVLTAAAMAREPEEPRTDCQGHFPGRST